MAGRSNLTFLSLEAAGIGTAVPSQSSGDTAIGNKDSGLGTRSPVSVEYRRLGRGKIMDDLQSLCSTMSLLGRGTPVSTESCGESASLQQYSSESDRRSCGRANVMRNIEQFKEQRQNDRDNGSGATISAEEKQLSRSSEAFFMPQITHGSKGAPTAFTCNYIRLQCDPNKGVHMYEVRFSPNVDSMNLRMKYLNEHRDKFGGTKTFDGVTLYLPIQLADALTIYVSHSVVDGSDIEVRILYKRKESLRNCIHLYNVLFSRVMKTLNYVRFERKHFDPTAPKIIPQAKLEVWPGYVTAVDEYDGDLMLCCDVSHRVLCQQSVLEKLVEIFKREGSAGFHDSAKKTLLGAMVITRYNNQTYRIDDIYFDKSPASTFQTKDGDTSFGDYYSRNYNIQIKDMCQPLLASIKKQRGQEQTTSEEFVICLVPELCYLTGLTDEMRSDQRLMREIATFTRVSPNQRLLALEKFYTNINNNPSALEILSKWGLTLKSSAEVVIGRKLEEEQIHFAKRFFPAGLNADFTRAACNNELLEVVHLNNWLILHCRSDDNVVKWFCEHMERNAPAFGIQVSKPQIYVLANDRVDTWVNALRSSIKKGLQMVVCICPKSRDDRYAAIKKVCCAEIPIPSQVINSRTLSNNTKNRSIVQKIALQMNCKMGGSLWSVKIPFKNVMICGIDSYHDAAQKSSSIAAFVASLNGTYTKWYSKVVIQTKREEIVNGLCISLIAALNAYEKFNGTFPDSVIIYRDGVGDGQLQLCTEYEIPQLEEACRQTFLRYKLKKKGGEVTNPPPGSVVDTEITRKKMYDFFLVSQSVNQGTVSPSHYVVLRDDANYSPDVIQRLSYKLCFMYYNWPGTIRIPACCQYAHKLAYLVGQSIRRMTSEDLADKLFYL